MDQSPEPTREDLEECIESLPAPNSGGRAGEAAVQGVDNLIGRLSEGADAFEALANYVREKTDRGSEFWRLREQLRVLVCRAQQLTVPPNGPIRSAHSFSMPTLDALVQVQLPCQLGPYNSADETSVYRDFVNLIERDLAENDIARVPDEGLAADLWSTVGELQSEGERILAYASRWFTDDVLILKRTIEMGNLGTKAPLQASLVRALVAVWHKAMGLGPPPVDSNGNLNWRIDTTAQAGRPPVSEQRIPSWDSDTHELRFDGHIVRRVRPIASWTKILDAFQE